MARKLKGSDDSIKALKAKDEKVNKFVLAEIMEFLKAKRKNRRAKVSLCFCVK